MTIMVTLACVSAGIFDNTNKVSRIGILVAVDASVGLVHGIHKHVTSRMINIIITIPRLKKDS